jgi:ankyrin repeat protein
LIENSPPEKRNDIAKNFKDRQFACGDGTLENLTVIYSEMSLGKQNFDAYLSKQKRLMTEAFIMPLFQKGLFKTIGIWQSQRTEIHHISSLVNAVADEFGLVKKTTVEDRYIKNTSRFQEVISTEVNKGFSTPEALTSLIDGVAEKIRSNLENQVDFSDPAFKDQVQSFIGGLDLPTSYNYNHLIDIENKCFKANLTDILRDIVGVTLDEKRILDIPNLEITKQRLAIEGSIDDKFKQRVSKDVLGDNPTEGTWKYILENGLKLNEKDFGTENPFEYCASQGIMIDGQSPINYFIKNDRPIRGFNPIVYAIEHLDFTAHSIDKAIDKKSLNKALFDTRNSGTFLILQELGADINSLNYKAQTLLSNAAEKGHKDILELLLSEKENNKVIFKVDNHGKTAFHYAAESNNNNLIEILAKNDPSNRGLLILDKKQDSPLHIAINMGRKENVETILSKDKKGKILFQNHNSLFGTSPLNLAIRKGDKEIINTLLSHGASPSLNTLIKSLIFSTKLSPDIKKSLCTSYINSWKPSKKTVDATVKVDTKIKTNSIKNSTQPTKER